jgi:uncharacterized protein (DUF58 family)
MNKAFTIGAVGFLLLVTALITRTGSIALMALPFLTYLGVGLLRSPSPDGIALVAERSLTLVPGGIQVRVAVRNASAAQPRSGSRRTGGRVGPIVFSDPLLPAMGIVDGSLSVRTTLEAGETAELQYVFRAARGNFSWETLHAVASDPFGLFPLGLELPAPGGIVVQPGLKRFKPFQLRPGSTLHSPGLIPARAAGVGTDFWGVREYHPGDPLRRVDWRRTARHPREIFTKEFEKEEIADTALVLDARESSDVTCGGGPGPGREPRPTGSLFEHALSATASLAEVFLRGGNRVSLVIVSDKMSATFPGYGKHQLNRIMRSLAQAAVGTGASHVSLDHLPLRMFGSRALVVVISPLLADDRFVFSRLRAHGNQGLLISPDPIDFTKSVHPRDPEGRLAVRIARVERRLELAGIARLGVRVIDWQVGQPLSPLVRQALRAGRL